MGGLTLYNFELDENCYRIRLCLSLLGLPWTPVAVDMVPGDEHRRAPLIELNPLGDLPILQDGDFVVSGPVAILGYLARRAGAEPWAPFADAKLQARVMSWLEYSASDLKAAREARWISLFGADGDLASARAAARRALRVMEDHMSRAGHAGELWFVGDAPTLADIALFPAFALSRDYGVGHEEFPALRRWMRRMRALPGFKTMPGVPDYY